jgi:hypothetical protein
MLYDALYNILIADRPHPESEVISIVVSPSSLTQLVLDLAQPST